MDNKKPFTFAISLSVLDHLGRNLYRSFITVLGEAVSNAWDADAKNVRIYIDKNKNSFFIKDDGIGMTADDFQNKFLKIGYSKRKEGQTVSPGGRPYIGRKGIGKLALLSCADKITVISKVKDADYIGGIIDNSGLDQAITDDLTPQEYQLGEHDLEPISKTSSKHNFDAGKMDKPEEILGLALVTGNETAVVLEPSIQALDLPALPVSPETPPVLMGRTAIV